MQVGRLGFDENNSLTHGFLLCDGGGRICLYRSCRIVSGFGFLFEPPPFFSFSEGLPIGVCPFSTDPFYRTRPGFPSALPPISHRLPIWSRTPVAPSYSENP